MPSAQRARFGGMMCLWEVLDMAYPKVHFKAYWSRLKETVWVGAYSLRKWG